MQTEVEVLIAGIVLFINGMTLNDPPLLRMHAAMAIEDNLRPNVPKISTFGIVLPIHETTLTVAESVVKSITGVNQSRVVTTAGFHTVVLSGDRIQFGSVVGNACVPLPVSGASPAEFQRIPALSLLVTDSTIASDALPAGDDFSHVSPTKVSAWMAMHDGDVAAGFVDEGKKQAVDFRPGRHKQKVADFANWKFSGPQDVPVCVAITPFAANRPDVVLEMELVADVDFRFTNLARKGIAAATIDEPHPGITYDWELFYDVLAKTPCVPPLPYVRITKDLADDLHAHAGTHPDELTGINCGPAQL